MGREGKNAAVERIEDFWSGRHGVVGLSVRTLFDALLAELNLSKGTVIVVSAINIDGMARIIEAHGLKLVVVDIDAQTLTPPPGAVLAACRQHAAPVCLIAQLYGTVSPIADAAELRAGGVTVVEDAAQAFAGGFYRGDPEASVSLFSFGPIKRATALGGGVAVMREGALAVRLRARLEGYQALSEAWFRRRALKYLLLKTLCSPVVYGLLFRLLIASGSDPEQKIGAVARGFSGQNLLTSIRKRPPPRLVALLAARLWEDHDHRARRSAALEAELRSEPVARPIGRAAARHAAWLVPLLFEEPEKVMLELRGAGFDATRGATSLRALDPKTAVCAARVMQRVLYLPHPIGLTADERGRLHRAIAAAASDVSSASGGPTP